MTAQSAAATGMFISASAIRSAIVVDLLLLLLVVDGTAVVTLSGTSVCK